MVWMYTALRMPVLIPFISGLDCYKGRGKGFRWVLGLNPFYFRAGLLHSTMSTSSSSFRLNPFYFRAGLLPHADRACMGGIGLNPFYFRAGLLRYPCGAFRSYGRVLIPFISGLDCYALWLATAISEGRS